MCLYKIRRRDTDIDMEGIPSDDRARDWGYTDTSQGTPGTIRNWKKKRGILRLWREHSPVNALICLLDSRTLRESIYIFQAIHIVVIVIAALGN